MAIRLKDWFFLNPDRDNFKPNAQIDSPLILCHEDVVSDDILGSIERRFASNEPVKMLMYGDWGVGKTHTINHISWWLLQHFDDYPARTVRIEIGDISKNTRFDVIVSQFLDEIGIHQLILLTHAFLQKTGNVTKFLEDRQVPSNVASAVQKFLLVAPGETPSQLVLQAFEYLKGRKLGSASASLGFGPQLTDSTELYGVLLAVAIIFYEVKGHRLIFIADEAAKIEAVDSDDAAQAHWVNVNKLIFDDNNSKFGFIYTASGRRQGLPIALTEPQLLNRIGENVFELQNLAPADVEGFLKKLRDHFVDKRRVEEAASTGQLGHEFDWETYPFTPEALRHFVDYFSRTQENAKPRDISSKLNDVAFIAAKQNKRLVDIDALQHAQM